MSRRWHSSICLLLTFVMGISPLAVQAQEAAQRALATQADPSPLLKFVPAEAAVIALARPRFILTHDAMRQFPTEVLTALGKKDFGIDPLDIEAALLIAAPSPAGPPAVGLVLQTRDSWETLTVQQRPPFMEAADRILIVASTPSFGEKIKASPRGELAPLARTIGEALRESSLDLAARVDLAKLRPLIEPALAHSPPLPPPFEPLKRTPELVSRVDLDLRMTETSAGSLTFHANNGADAGTFEGIVTGALQGARATLIQQMTAQTKSDDPVDVAAQQYAQRVMDSIFDAIRPRRTENRVAFVAESDSAYNAATIGVLLALLLPAVNAAREAARRNGAMNQLKQLSLAMLNYEAIHNTFPAQANYDAAGKPLLSWRVHILPFIEQKELYQQFHLDEPWDSEHNLKLIDKMPDLYANPNLDEPGKTNFLVPVGEGTVFDGKAGRRIRDITDGTSHTLLMVEANADRAVIWTRPDDLQFDPSNPLAGLGQLRTGGFLAARCDGSVSFFPLDLAAERIAAMFTRAGGEAAR